MARESGLAPAFLRELMQAVGRPNPGRGERIFTDEDIETARVIKRFVDAGLPRRELLEVGRVVGQGMAHTSEAVRRVVGNALLQPGDSEYTVGLRFAQAADELAPLVPTLLDQQFRAHLRDGMRRELVSESERERAGWPARATSPSPSPTSSATRAWASSCRRRTSGASPGASPTWRSPRSSGPAASSRRSATARCSPRPTCRR